MGNISIAKCETHDMYLSNNGLRTLKDIQNIIEAANMLAIVTATIPFFDIFLDPSKPHEKLFGAASYDWQQFAKVMRSIPEHELAQIRTLSGTARLKSSGNKYEFWRCVYDAVN